jgi:single-strand DNA-binding protein
MLNKVIITGRITRDLELKYTQNSVAVLSFDIACERDYKSNGERDTDFLTCVAWRNEAEFIARNFSKGRMITVVGRLEVRTWQDKDGKSRKIVEVVVEKPYFGDKKSVAEEAPAESQYEDVSDTEDDELPW